MALQVQDKRYLILFQKNSSVKDKNNLAFHPGPVQPPSGEGSSISTLYYYIFFRREATDFLLSNYTVRLIFIVIGITGNSYRSIDYSNTGFESRRVGAN